MDPVDPTTARRSQEHKVLHTLHCWKLYRSIPETTRLMMSNQTQNQNQMTESDKIEIA